MDLVATEAAEDSGGGRRAANIATVRMLEVLSMFAFDKPSFGVTEISKRLGMSKNMVHRALVTLVEHDFLVRDATGQRYELGYGVLTLQNPFAPVPDLRALAAPTLRRIHELTGLTTQLSMRVGDNQVVIDGVEAFGPSATRPKIGLTMPLHASAASRAILASLKDTEIEDYMRRNAPLKRFTERTLVMPDEIWAEVRKVRARGYAESFEDYGRGSNGYSFPILGAGGEPHGAVTIGGPAGRFGWEALEAMRPTITTCVASLRRQAAIYDVL